MTTPLATPGPPTRLPLRRPARGRVVGGVCGGVAIHLGVRVAVVRWVFVGLTLLAGSGVAAYVFLWLTVPAGEPDAVARALADPSRARAARPNEPVVLRPSSEAGRPAQRASGLRELTGRLPLTDIAIGVILVVVALSLVGSRFGWRVQASWLLPVLIVVAGALLAWSQLDRAQRGRLLAQAGGRTPMAVVRVLGGIALVALGALLLVGQEARPRDILPSAVAALAVLAGAALVLAPWWLRLITDLGEERAARERADERAEIAAHLHDSVLQSLALIQRSAQNPVDVVRIARTQERELRAWLYEDQPRSGTSFAADLKTVAAEVEELTGVAIDVVVVGDATPTAATEALLRATREALLNAARHGAPPVSLYLEAVPDRVEVSVRDHGPGFDPEAVAPDRLGVKESIVGRTVRHGGTAVLRRPPSGGTEVRMVMPIELTAPTAADAAPTGAQAPTSDPHPGGPA